MNDDAIARLTPAPQRRARLQAAKLLHSKWTAAVPRQREKHFIVTALLAPELGGGVIDEVEMEAVFTRRRFTLRWRTLADAAVWLRGWR